MIEWIIIGILLLMVLLQLLVLYALWYIWNTYLTDKNNITSYAEDIRNLALVSLGEQPISSTNEQPQERKKRGLFAFYNNNN